MKLRFLFQLLLVAGLLIVSLQPTLAQGSRTISGIVVDESGLPLPGATISRLGAAGDPVIGTSTDINGHFLLSLPATSSQIVVTYLGYETELIPLTTQTDYRIVLKLQAQLIEEVVVTGVFTRKANSYTGAVTSIKREELLQAGNQNLVQSLKNLDPSFLQLDNLAQGSNPNARPELQMRGQSSFPDIRGEYQQNPNQPLFILDGFETDLTKILDLDMNIVESITLLKDATAKAMYGSKAGNGVIVIETRKPQAGRMRISYNSGISLEVPDLSSYNLTNAAEKLELERMAGLFDSENVRTRIDRQKRYNNILMEVLSGVDTDWLYQPIRTGIGHKHALYMEGGDQNLLYGLDLSTNNINGAMKGSDRNTFSGGITLSYRMKKFLFRNKIAITDNNSNESPWGDFSAYASMNPYSRIYDDKGKLIQSYNYTSSAGNIETQTNPIWNSMINTKNLSRYTDISNNFYSEWALTETFKFIGRLGYTRYMGSADIFRPASHTSFVNFTGDDIYRKGSYYQNHTNNEFITGDIGVNYAFNFGKHLVFTNGQVNVSSYSYDNASFHAEGFPNDNMDHIIFATRYLKDAKPSGRESISRNVGGIASANYSFDEKYLFDANFRLTGSSEFGANNRWGTFWSVGGGWNMHNEAFLANSNLINMLKLRFSTGYTGTQGFNSYQAMATVRYNTNASYNGFLGSYLVSLANPNLAWQKKYDQNIGTDFLLFNNRLSGRLDYYLSTTTSMLTDVTVPQSTGFVSYRENLGESENKGFEAYLAYRVWENKRTRSFVNVFSSAASNTNTIKKISESLRQYNEAQDAIKESLGGDKQQITSPSIRFVEGQSFTAIWAVRSLGIDPANGKEIFLTKDGQVTYNYSTADQVVVGDLLPRFNGNFGLSAEVKNFGMFLSMNYRIGGQIYNQTLVDKVENANIMFNVDSRVYQHRWQKPGDVALYKALGDFSYTRPTSRFVEDYNILSLSSLSFSYDFRDTQFIRNSFVERLKLQFFMNELFHFSSVKMERGTQYPFARNFTFSLQASF